MRWCKYGTQWEYFIASKEHVTIEHHCTLPKNEGAFGDLSLGFCSHCHTKYPKELLFIINLRKLTR